VIRTESRERCATKSSHYTSRFACSDIAAQVFLLNVNNLQQRERGGGGEARARDNIGAFDVVTFGA